jgi:hypothetical protein
MRFATFAFALAAICLPNAAFAAQAAVFPQIEYTNIQDRFRTNFPTQPRVQDTTVTTLNVTSGEEMVLKARRHVSEWNGGTYSVTVVDFAPYLEPHNVTIQSSMGYAATQFRQMGKVTYDAYQRTDRIPGHIMYITLPSGERLYVLMILHQETVQGTQYELNNPAQRRLYIAEAKIPADERPPSLFLTSLQVVEANGMRIRYEPNGVWKLPANAQAPDN